MRTEAGPQSASTGSQSASRKGILDTVSNVVTIAAGVAILATVVAGFIGPNARRNTTDPGLRVPEEPVPIDGAAKIGSPQAKVALIEYVDFQCPYCRRFALSVLPALRAKYVETGQLLLVFRHFPLANHPLAAVAAESAVCADKQGKFREAYEEFFRVVEIGEVIQRLPAAVALNADQFAACLAQKAKGQVDEDVATAARLKIGSTPVFLVGAVERDGWVKIREIVRGAKPLADFERAIDEAIRATGRTAAK
jgi:protein-disulfide isomerase